MARSDQAEARHSSRGRYMTQQREPYRFNGPTILRQGSRTAFLHASSKLENDLQPVVEMKWELGKPDEIGFRLADSPANQTIKRWQLHFRYGSEHLWRELRINNGRWITPDQLIQENKSQEQVREKPASQEFTLDFGNSPTTKVLQWQTNETVPLQILERDNPSYVGMGLYPGLLPMMSLGIPAILNPSLAVDISDQHRAIPGQSCRAAPSSKKSELSSTHPRTKWIWLSVQMKQPTWPN